MERDRIITHVAAISSILAESEAILLLDSEFPSLIEHPRQVKYRNVHKYFISKAMLSRPRGTVRGYRCIIDQIRAWMFLYFFINVYKRTHLLLERKVFFEQMIKLQNTPRRLPARNNVIVTSWKRRYNKSCQISIRYNERVFNLYARNIVRKLPSQNNEPLLQVVALLHSL